MSTKGDVDNVTSLIHNGADINTISKSSGGTALHYAAKFSDKQVVEYLLGKGISVNATGKCSKTPISWANEKDGENANSSVLLMHGAILAR